MLPKLSLLKPGLALVASLGFLLSTRGAHAEPGVHAEKAAKHRPPLEGPAARKQTTRQASVSGLELLRAADGNRDARVSEVELLRFVEHEVLMQVQRRVPRLDRNGDGRVTRAEVPDMSASRFQRFDLDGDGAFTMWEIAQVMRRLAIQRSRVVFAQLDVDRDGALSMADVQQPAERVAEFTRAKSESH